MNYTAANRDHVIEQIWTGFVAPSKANRAIYRYILLTLWPAETDLPGPVVTREQLRSGVNAARRAAGATKDYLDVFRRLRELQGEEGLLGIVKVGASYQMLSADVGEKRIPRAPIPAEVWNAVVSEAGGACRVCRVEGQTAGPSMLVPDHRIPRSRLNEAAYQQVQVDAQSNLQPLCQNCNTHKSVACRGCGADCHQCPWAFPEVNPLVTIRGDILRALSHLSDSKGVSVQALVDEMLARYLTDEQ